MKAFTHPLTTIFGKDVRYVVPLYQRPYVWEEETHWAPLWEDIQTVVGQLLYSQRIAANAPAGTPPLSTPPHFLGAIVLDQQLVGTGSLEVRYVIDGQQRLTTMQLFIAAASNAAQKRSCDKESRLLRRLTENDEDLITGPDDRFKVWPTNVNRAPFREAMLRLPSGPLGENLIVKAYNYFFGAINDWADDGDEHTADERMAALAAVVRDLMKLVVIDLEEGDNAQVIFETLNARGMPLLAIDLVKNLVFQRAALPDVDLDDLYWKNWAPFEEDYWREDVRQGRLNRPRAELFLMHWLTMQRAEEVGAHHLYPTFRLLISEPTAPPIVDVIKEFARDAALFKSFDSQPPGSVEKQFFDRLTILDTTTALPIALFLFRQPPDVLSPGQRRNALMMLESWLVRRMLCRMTTKNYNRHFLDILKLLKADPSNSDAVLFESLSTATAPTTVWPSYAQLSESLVNGSLYNQVSQPRIVMALTAVEHAMRSDKSENVSLPSGLTIEHVMPTEWREHWPVTPADDPVKTGGRERRLNRIGNLTLVTGKLNPSMSNGAWPTKRQALNEHSVLLLNRRLVDENPDEWDEAHIDQRSAALVALLDQTWPGPTAGVWQQA